MIARLLICTWYVLCVGQGSAVLIAATGMGHGDGLSTTCAAHQCACTAKGLCDAECCCTPGTQKAETPDEPTLTTCGRAHHHLPRALEQPHLVPEALVGPAPVLLPTSAGFGRAHWSTVVPEAPDKIPILPSH